MRFREVLMEFFWKLFSFLNEIVFYSEQNKDAI